MAIDKKGMKILYGKLQKALYELMRASLLFYRKLRKEFEAWGFMINPYDLCVANKMTEGDKQLTVLWHVDDLMASCADNFELTKFLCYLAQIYGPKLSMHTGKKHNYLGVDMEFNDDGTLDISMIKYLKNIIDEFLEIIKERAVTPAHDKLFVIRDENDIKNGKMSSGKKTKHIRVKFFFIKDRVDNGEIKVIDCPTEEMWADVMTKPLQGMAFRTMRVELMNCPVNYDKPEEEAGEHATPISATKTVT